MRLPLAFAAILVTSTACAGPAGPPAHEPVAPSGGATRRSADARTAAPPPQAAAAPEASPGPSEVYGHSPAPGLPAAHIQARIRAAAPSLRACYESEAPAREPGATDTLLSAFRIGVDGRVEDVTWEGDSVGSESLRACVERVLRELRFDPPRGGATVTIRYPLHFRAGD